MEKCKKCNRLLIKPESIAIGLGPTCAKREGIVFVKKRNKKEEEKYVPLTKFEG